MSKFEWEIRYLIKRPNQLKEHIENNLEKYDNMDWLAVRKSSGFTLDIAEKYSEFMDWGALAVFYDLPEDFIKRNIDKLDIFGICTFQNLSYNFIIKNINILNLDAIMNNEKISKEIKNKLNPEYLKRLKDPKEVERWERIQLKNKEFSGLLRKKYDRIDHPEKYAKPKKKKVNNNDKIEKKKINNNNKIEKKKVNRKQSKVKKELDLDTLNKKQLKEIAEKMGIRVYYHDTIPILKEKIKKKEADKK